MRAGAESGPVGLLPAAGFARRLGHLPCSKEVLPIGFVDDPEGEARPRVVSEVVLERMRRAGVRRVHFVLRPGKWDIPSYFGSGEGPGVSIAYHVTRESRGPACTLDIAYPFLAGSEVVLGFPDLIFEPADAYDRLLAERRDSGAAVVLGLFPASRPSAMDLVRTNGRGLVVDLEIKPDRSDLNRAWVIAAWGPEFTEFLHDQVAGLAETVEDGEEHHVGGVFLSALESGLALRSVDFPAGRCIDVGTLDALAAVWGEAGDVRSGGGRH